MVPATVRQPDPVKIPRAVALALRPATWRPAKPGCHYPACRPKGRRYTICRRDAICRPEGRRYAICRRDTICRPKGRRYSALFIPILLLILLGAAACKRSSPPSAKRPDTEARPESAAQAGERREAADRLKAAIERAGGSEVWIKRESSAGDGTVVEALASPAAFDPSLAALKAECQAQSIRMKVHTQASAGGLRSVEADLGSGRQSLGKWRLREVRQLLRASIVIDDLGENLAVAHQLLELPYPLTFSVLPRLPHSQETARDAHRAGREVMLHLPMQPDPATHIAVGAGALTVGMPEQAVVEVVRSDLDAVPYARGVNNHEGSLATTDRALMASVMQVLSERRVYFIDSRTTADTVALEAARQAGIPAFYRSVFLDNTRSTDYSLGQLRELCRIVRAQGAALAIGHPNPTTVAALREFLPQLERQDIELVPASDLVRLPEVARLSPPRPADNARKGK